MGTRADFYVGRGKDAEWLGSVAFDGYPDNEAYRPILIQFSEKGFREMVAKELASRDDATLPEQGWPWPWEDSGTTDCAYAFDGGKVYVTWFGHGWDSFAEYEAKRKREQEAEEKDEELPEEPERPKVEFPNMKDRQNVTYGHRSGALFMSVPARKA